MKLTHNGNLSSRSALGASRTWQSAATQPEAYSKKGWEAYFKISSLVSGNAPSFRPTSRTEAMLRSEPLGNRPLSTLRPESLMLLSRLMVVSIPLL